MIGRLRGILVSRRGEVVSVEVGGVGYEVTMTPRGVSALPGVGEEVVVHTHTHVREDEMSLYGFGAEADRDLFRILLGAGGVGPKLAMSILGAMTHQEIVRSIVTEDADALTVVPGVGKRGAQKIVLELGPKLAGVDVEVVGSTNLVTVRQALEGLGYSTEEINGVMGEL
ncbi:MAG TPA: Holliday junction branch migration protein RuvA, partial [Acidimicrobiia bacterium]|nr:Holliday junction branch migration protein RuvA [Acidimicrobiia bacterium]